MNDEMERRLARWLRAAAPPAAPELAERILRQTAATPQRRPWPAAFSPPFVLATAAVTVLAVVVGLQLGRFIEGAPMIGGDPTPGVRGSAAPDSTPVATAPGTATPGPRPTTPPAGQTCHNAELGYSLTYPDGWFTNPSVPAEPPLVPVAACRFFAPQPFQIGPNRGTPAEVVIAIQRVDGPSEAGEVHEARTDTVAGRQATVRRLLVTPGGFLPEGTRIYEYLVPLGDGSLLQASATAIDEGRLEELAIVLDGMMSSLAFDE